VYSRYSEFVRQLTGLCNVSVAFAHDGSADEGSMASIERTNPLHVFLQHVFFCLLARSSRDHIVDALGVVSRGRGGEQKV
jgi:hypothetical protein